MEPTFETHAANGWTVVSISGELDLSTSAALRSALESGLADDPPRLAVDLTKVSFMDSSSLGVLVAYLKRAREQAGDLMLVGVQGSPAKVISLTGLDAVFRMEDSLADLPA
ncbi:MAG: STAS domain-containing protein [Actinomycetota bacterium]